jgi:superfamily II DNA/RNA helicase
MIATDIVARGLDFPALRHVVLYVQEIEGRGGGGDGGREREKERKRRGRKRV